MIKYKVTIKSGWWNARKSGTVIGDDLFISNQQWTPIIWDGESRLNWHETRGLMFDPPRDTNIKEGEKE